MTLFASSPINVDTQNSREQALVDLLAVSEFVINSPTIANADKQKSVGPKFQTSCIVPGVWIGLVDENDF